MPTRLSLAVLAAVLTAPVVSAAPPLPDRPAKWEYAELQYRNTFAGGRTTNGFGRGRADEPAEQKGNPAEAPAPAPPAPPAIRWTTGAGEVEAKTWADLAEKLKAPAQTKKDPSATTMKISLFNYLGSEGWELVDHQSGGATAAAGAWTFKRRVP